MPYLALVLILLSVSAIGVLIAFYMSVFQISKELPALDKQLAQLRVRANKSPPEQLPYEQLVSLRTQIKALNEIMHTEGQPLSSLLLHIEEQIPDGVWLVNLQFRARENGAKLVAEANQIGVLTEFMERLESSEYFSQVLLTRQTQPSVGANIAIQFEIQLRGK